MNFAVGVLPDGKQLRRISFPKVLSSNTSLDDEVDLEIYMTEDFSDVSIVSESVGEVSTATETMDLLDNRTRAKKKNFGPVRLFKGAIRKIKSSYKRIKTKRTDQYLTYKGMPPKHYKCLKTYVRTAPKSSSVCKDESAATVTCRSESSAESPTLSNTFETWYLHEDSVNLLEQERSFSRGGRNMCEMLVVLEETEHSLELALKELQEMVYNTVSCPQTSKDGIYRTFSNSSPPLSNSNLVRRSLSTQLLYHQSVLKGIFKSLVSLFQVTKSLSSASAS